MRWASLRSSIAAAALLLGSGLVSTPARADAPAVFQVGFSVRDITPTTPQYLGGFGQAKPVGPERVHDPLQVRTIAIASGSTLVSMTIVDTQGWFAGYMEGPWGVTDARNDAAAALHAALPSMSVDAGSLIISSTHSHAAPTIMGVWGSTDVEYLKRVHDETVASIVDASTHLRAANLYAATADISGIIGSHVSETDVNQGWKADGSTPILWAKDPVTQATLGMYVNVPVHADVVIGVRSGISADHIGVERTLLGAKLGGTAVVAMGTLGRQETFVQTDGFRAMDQVGAFVTTQILRALADATPLTDATLAASTQYFAVPLTNPALAAFNAAGATGRGGPNDETFSTCDIPEAGTCPIDRSMLPPYSEAGMIGTWATAIRIGSLVYATEPGEAFPEVSTQIRRTFTGALPDVLGGISESQVRIIGMAQDQIGYYFPVESTTFTTVPNNSDFLIYNSSVFMADGNTAAHLANAARLGIVPAPAHESNQSELKGSTCEGVQMIPVGAERALSPSGAPITFVGAISGSAWGRFMYGNPASGGLQDVTGADLHATAGPFTDPIVGSNHAPTSIAWSFGDGGAVGGGKEITHTYTTPGTYTATATVQATGDCPGTFSHVVVIDPALTATVTPSGGLLRAGVAGGSGTILAAHWLFDDATTAEGLSVPLGSHGLVTVVDSAGTTSQSSF